jgi:hypothetical protein
MLEMWDVHRVRRLALGAFWFREKEMRDVAEVVRMFGGLKELFLVQGNLEAVFGRWKESEYWDGSSYEWEELEKGKGRDLWAWVECDVADTLLPRLANGWLRHLDFTFTNVYNYAFLNYRREQGGDGTGFFAQLGKKFEDELRVARSKVAEEDEVLIWSVPDVKVVHVGTIRRLKELFGVRDRIWKVARDMERGGLDNELTTRQTDFWPGELSPVSSAVKNSLEILTSDVPPFQRGRSCTYYDGPPEYDDW